MTLDISGIKIEKIMTAPIVLFVYNRPEHTMRTIKALQANLLSKSSYLYIFSDSNKSSTDKSSVEETRSIIRNINGFKSIEIIERDRNYGLAKNIIDGLTEILDVHDKAIVLEDDIVTSPYFLLFMNRALEKYQHSENVWHISGWNYPIDPEGLPDVFFWGVMNCWGWGTWRDRWIYFKKEPATLINQWKKSEIKRFNLNGAYNFWAQVKGNYTEKLNTWAVFWYATIFENDGLCLNPAVSFVENIGHDGSGVNCGYTNIYKSKHLNYKIIEFPSEIEISQEAVERIRKYYRDKNTTLSRMYNKFVRMLR